MITTSKGLSFKESVMLKIEIPAIPPSVNHYWKANGKRRFLTKRAREWKRLTHDCVRNILPHKWKPISSYVRVEITLYFKFRRGDLDNRVKAILDALNGLVWIDDSQVDDFRVKRKVVGYDKTVVVVEEL